MDPYWRNFIAICLAGLSGALAADSHPILSLLLWCIPAVIISTNPAPKASPKDPDPC